MQASTLAILVILSFNFSDYLQKARGNPGFSLMAYNEMLKLVCHYLYS
jgi:ABC-type spermidine/putrescine transport system permease subunit II